ncbi:MAG: heme-binding protein [Gammaproteobacteria bacterium]|nr:heme-binding protein [Gammaproteobacteria bacterium]
MSLETPEYTVLYSDGQIEYRQYDAYLISETIIKPEDGYKSAGNEGFRRLFRYITGNNKAQSDIAMTAPVEYQPANEKFSSEKIEMTTPVQRELSDEGWRVSFMLPSKYTMETAPVPSDPRVQIREVPGQLMAVLRYSGRWTSKNAAKKEAQLYETLAGQSLTVLSEVKTALYNAPYTPPFMRRNEVMVEVDRLPAAAIDDLQASAEGVASY